jgi:hypothetical protein
MRFMTHHELRACGLINDDYVRQLETLKEIRPVDDPFIGCTYENGRHYVIDHIEQPTIFDSSEYWQPYHYVAIDKLGFKARCPIQAVAEKCGYWDLPED